MTAGDYVVPGGLDAARADARANEWDLIEIERPDPGEPDRVLDQSPAPDTEMVSGSALVLTVSVEESAAAEPEE